MKIEIKKLTPNEIKEKNIETWPIWEKEESQFDWFYDSEELCYILDGEIEVTDACGEVYAINAGDFVVFPKGLKCNWKIKKTVRKHYSFK